MRIQSTLTPFVVLVLACASGQPTSAPPPPPGPGPVTTIPPGPYTAGQSYFGRNEYIEYIAGNAPVILSAPHGGALTPAEISARTCGTNTTDLNTDDLVRRMQASFFARTGRYPHVLINRLSRSRLDANRDSVEATCGDAEGGIAWSEWHAFMAVVRAAVLSGEGRGWYMDVHGHGHAVQRLELGYLISDAALELSNAQLDAVSTYESQSSIRGLSVDAATSFSALLRGPLSLGSLYASEGFPAVPSESDPDPGGAPYFNGGYNSQRYGCSDGGRLCGVQIEANLTAVRDSPESRSRFADATVRVLQQYLGMHWGIDLGLRF
jgi:hypothetical protein